MSDATRDPLDIGLIGLGVMGQRMLERLQGHAQLRPTWVWDADAGAVARTLQRWPGLRAADSAAALIAAPGLRSLYIATPPASHMALSEQAFDAGLAVLCEKPLATDEAEARRVAQRIAREGHRAAVHFPLAASPALAALQQAFGADAPADAPLGPLRALHIELAYAAWPRPWQAAAGAWLAQRAEGGFTREVLSHFIFALQRVLGPAQVQQAQAVHPADGSGAETALRATLRAGGVDIHIDGRVAADVPVPDHNRLRWLSERGEVDLQQWFGQVRLRRGGPDADPQALPSPAELAAALGAAAPASALDQWAALIEGRPQQLPGYAEALAVQQTIEALLRG